jgi:large subunit ribosomal protein L17
MRHHNRNKKFGRVRKQRTALLRSLCRNLILKHRIATSEARAKALRPFIERLVTKAKTDSVASRRLVASRLGGDQYVAQRLAEDVAPQYKKRPGGYTRITKIGPRMSDSSQRAVIEFV